MKSLWYEFLESIHIAVEQVNEHRMRSLLTALGVIIGIVAVTLMGTAISGIDSGFTKNLSILGTNTFYIEKRPWMNVGDDWAKYRNRPPIQASYTKELNEFIQNNPDSNLVIAVPMVETLKTVSRAERSISRVQIFGTNADYPLVDNAEIEHGRFISDTESISGKNIVVLGNQVAQTLFPEEISSALGKHVFIQKIKYEVVGIYKKQGSLLGIESFDNNVVIPLPSMRKFFVSNWWNSATIKVEKKPDANFQDAIDEITGAMRLIRSLDPDQEDNFAINQSNAIEEEIAPIKNGIAIAGFGITGLALFVGAIGIMNITFVSVKERTREIGTRRAIGAKKRSILIQFLMEAVMICLLGGIIGVLLSFGLKIILQKFLADFPLILSGQLILIAMVVSIATGLISGLAPAWQASRLDPAEALRHE
jgi:putative ABC transport system permease protein